MSLHYVRVTEIYQSDMRAKKQRICSICLLPTVPITFGGTVYHLVRCWAVWSTGVGRDIPSAHYGFKKVTSNVLQVSVDEVVNGKEFSKIGRWRVLRPEQKSVTLMKGLVWKFRRPGDLVLEAFAGTLFTGKEYLLL